MTKLIHRLLGKNANAAEKRTAIGKLSGTVGIACNLLLFFGKLSVGLLSASVSIIADAMNNLSDASSAFVTFLGFKLSEKPADADHPYGHARYE
jgi:divalent metal cation (Fe/Co/Zn/Cd) transporter